MFILFYGSAFGRGAFLLRSLAVDLRFECQNQK